MKRPDLETLIALTRAHEMSQEEREAQRRSFAYGNTRLSNPSITREMVDEVATRLAKESDPMTEKAGTSALGALLRAILASAPANADRPILVRGGTPEGKKLLAELLGGAAPATDEAAEPKKAAEAPADEACDCPNCMPEGPKARFLKSLFGEEFGAQLGSTDAATEVKLGTKSRELTISLDAEQPDVVMVNGVLYVPQSPLDIATAGIMADLTPDQITVLEQLKIAVEDNKGIDPARIIVPVPPEYVGVSRSLQEAGLVECREGFDGIFLTRLSPMGIREVLGVTTH